MIVGRELEGETSPKVETINARKAHQASAFNQGQTLTIDLMQEKAPQEKQNVEKESTELMFGRKPIAPAASKDTFSKVTNDEKASSKIDKMLSLTSTMGNAQAMYWREHTFLLRTNQN